MTHRLPRKPGRFDEVTLTPPNGDGGKDVIAVKKGFGAVRLVESVKLYKQNLEVNADLVRALISVIAMQTQTSKGIISTTWESASRIMTAVPGLNTILAKLSPSRRFS